MRQWNRLSLTLPLGLAVAALYIPLRLVWAANSPPTAIEAALRFGPGESTPHFFSGDTQLLSYERRPEQIPHPLHAAAVMAAPTPNVDQRPIQPPRSELAPATVSAVSTVAVPPPNVDQRPIQPPRSELAPATINAVSTVAVPSPTQPTVEPAIVPAAAPSIAWQTEQPLDVHFFPRRSPVSFASDQQATPPAQAALPAPRLRATEIQSVGAAQVAIAPAQPVTPHFGMPSQNAAPYATTLNRPVASTAPTQAPANFASFSRLPIEQPAAQSAVTVAPPAPRPELPPTELVAPQASTIAFENKSLHGPHYFAGSMQLTSLERQTNLQSPPLKQMTVQPTTIQPTTPPALPPAEANQPQIAAVRESVRPQPTSLAIAPPLPPVEVNQPQVASVREPVRPQLTSLPIAPPLPPVEATQPQIAAVREPVRPQPTSVLLPSPSRPNPAAVAARPSPVQSLTPFEPELTSLIISGREPIKPLLPAEVLAAANLPPLREEFRLTSLQQTAIPGVNLQPTEVLPIPTPYSPTAPRLPAAIDADRPIGAVTTNISDRSGRMPTDLAIERFRGEYPPYLPRGWEDSAYLWDAPSMCIGPLRYEEVNLERFGYSHCPAIQPVLSGFHFLGATLALPYSIAAQPFGTCTYPLGHYRPGSPVPFQHIRPELRPWPASAECMAIAGLILLIP